MSIIHVTAENYAELVAKNELALLDFYADWCGPCRMIAPILEQIAEEDESVVIAKINVDEQPDLARKYGIMNIPTLVVIKGDQEIRRASGARPKDQIKAMLAE